MMLSVTAGLQIVILVISAVRVGCDGVVGSGRALDACGVCGGDSSACRRVAGLFTRPTLPPGYNLVATLPAAACNVTVAELRPSRNFLALRRQDGSFILNGDWAVVRPGEYDGFTYRRHDPESITAAGPLRSPVDIMIIYQEPNPGIKYEYMLPMKVEPVPPIPGINPRPNDKHLKDGSPLNGLDKSPAFPYGTGVQATESQPAPPPARPRGRRRKFVWRVTGFSECSQTCGGGVQTAVVQCVREATQQPVPERRCPEKRPPPQTRRCHTKQPCPPQWEAGEWGPCSVSCGRGGSQSRPVVCRQQLTSDLNMVVSDGACAMTPAPARSQPCDGPPCPGHEPEWRAGPWGECSAPCGQGNRSRAVMCQGPYGQSGEEECPQSDRPADEEPCNMGPCPETRSLKHSWLYTEWSQQCSQECGTGIQTRRVICSEGRDAACDATSKPEDRRACSSQRHCAGQWFAGPWGQCSCGLARQTRSVICIATVRGQQRVTHESSCPHGLKPPSERSCQPNSCPSEFWFTSDWSQCSRTCGTGEQSREVHCLDEKQKLTNTCPEELRPPARRTCNTHECGTQAATSGDTEKRGNTHHIKSNDNPVQNNGVNDQAIPDNNGADEVHHKGNECVDKFPNCHLVVQARLCKYKYYHNNCCHSCRKKF